MALVNIHFRLKKAKQTKRVLRVYISEGGLSILVYYDILVHFM